MEVGQDPNWSCSAKGKNLTQWSSDLLVKPLVAQLLKNLRTFIEPEGSLLCTEELSTGPYPEPHESRPHHPKFT
jgi:hypothetical protein